MTPESYVQQLTASQEFFERSTSTLTEADGNFAPVEGMYTTTALVAHVAQTVEWFLEGAFRPEGFSLEFEAAAKSLADVNSLAEARDWVSRAFQQAREVIGGKSAEELAVLLPAGPVMGGKPRSAILSGIEEHTAHHRGALSVYARLRGHRPPMPYGEM